MKNNTVTVRVSVSRQLMYPHECEVTWSSLKDHGEAYSRGRRALGISSVLSCENGGRRGPMDGYHAVARGNHARIMAWVAAHPEAGGMALQKKEPKVSVWGIQEDSHFWGNWRKWALYSAHHCGLPGVISSPAKRLEWALESFRGRGYSAGQLPLP